MNIFENCKIEHTGWFRSGLTYKAITTVTEPDRTVHRVTRTLDVLTYWFIKIFHGPERLVSMSQAVVSLREALK